VTGSESNCRDGFSWGGTVPDVGENGRGRCELAHSEVRASIVRMTVAPKLPSVAEP
jgi:hypothetical protein